MRWVGPTIRRNEAKCVQQFHNKQHRRHGLAAAAAGMLTLAIITFLFIVEYFKYFARCYRNNLRMYEKVHIYCSESNKNAIFCDGNHFGAMASSLFWVRIRPSLPAMASAQWIYTCNPTDWHSFSQWMARWTRENVKNKFSFGLRSICDIWLCEVSASRHDLWNIINCLCY